PTREASPQEPASAAAGPQISTSRRLANSPSGSSRFRIVENSWSRSERSSTTLNGDFAPATGFAVPALKPGSNAVFSALPVISKLDRDTIDLPLQESSWVTAS